MSQRHWWAYRHINNEIKVKRYLDQGDIDQANRSDFVQAVTAPYPAETRDQAEIRAGRLLSSPKPTELK